MTRERQGSLLFGAGRRNDYPATKKRDRIAELRESGKTLAEVAKAVRLTVEQVRYQLAAHAADADGFDDDGEPLDEAEIRRRCKLIQRGWKRADRAKAVTAYTADRWSPPSVSVSESILGEGDR